MMQYAYATNGDLLTTITVCLWQEFHSRTCTELSLWWLTPYYTLQWSKKHQSPFNEWCLSQCWIGTNPATHSPARGYTTALPTQKMGHVLTSRHRGSLDRQCAFFYLRVCTGLSLSPTLHLLQKTWARRERGLWSVLQRSRAWMFLTPCTFCLWWGTHCQNGLQEVSISGSHQA